jgi:hypothetical protein
MIKTYDLHKYRTWSPAVLVFGHVVFIPDYAGFDYNFRIYIIQSVSTDFKTKKAMYLYYFDNNTRLASLSRL